MKPLKKVLILVLVVGITIGAVGVFREVGPPSLRLRRGEGSIGESPEKAVENRPLKFAVMSDIHSDWGNFRKALEKVRDFGDIGGFVVITGDLTTIGKKSELLEAKKILDESGLPYYVIPGNHDIWWGRRYKKDVWEEVFGESFFSFKEDGIKFILVNNGDGVGGFEGFGDIGEQMDWLIKETEECLRVYCLVFMHMPLNHPNSLHVMGEDNPKVASEAAELIELLTRNKVKEIFAGHLHFSSSYELEGLRTTIVGAITSERNFQSPKFLGVETRDGSLEKKDIFLAD